MRTRSIAFAVVTLAALGGVWISYDDGFGRPHKIVEREEEFQTIPIRLARSDPYAATFSLCAGPVRVNCVIDGDTFWFKGEKVRIADINVPEISEPECPEERRAGEAARDRLVTLLNAGPFSMTSGWRDQDRYGRKLRNVVRSEKSLGETLVEEGLARRWDGSGFRWCDGGGS
ncbi:thermonuclease family protein [Rhizobium sp. NFR03]|uniref:thermonuclease family protein n=1 Tax=Rhizobium sp. NFR03 TaxID=1566263 RepID=UPI0008D8D078|nr:thermonuclease family protein [Rhizobium sp. NFR03]SES41150.1 nuclease homologue [Rhizobium sp. NFR03]